MVTTAKYKSTVKFILLLLGAFIMLYPLLWMISSSLKPSTTIFREIGLWPSQLTFENYKLGWEGMSGFSFTTFFKNSFNVVGLSILGTLLSSSFAAYAFARLNFSFKKTLFAIMLGSMMLPHHVVLIPQYIFFNHLEWVDTILPLVVPKFLATDAFFIFLMVQFIRGIPKELDEAARVDGCGHVQIFSRIILPLMLPALVTSAIFTFIWTWNDFFSQFIYLSNPKLWTVTLALRGFLDSMGESMWGSMFAMSILSLVPIFLFFIFFQKMLIEGIATTGIK
ncbi:carbohydrate ABC transporter permease [Metabacillus halosaccharovorans]|uniref:carbohydrate ABC transporter permease n=1 Tax=Metabacillus halosaccharovorans TaxID=930124 RepID=UPI00203C2AF3|nr:carbohydrate ABC transporter permease [Metabacillus halosaccharovorans]MCM3439372.1 carbohydrate ABC transporter permease [Metabacillus halosaccharovorans]